MHTYKRNFKLNFILKVVRIITSHCIYQSGRKIHIISYFFTFYSSDFCCLVSFIYLFIHLSIHLSIYHLSYLHSIPLSEGFTDLSVSIFFESVILAILQAVIVSQTGCHSRNIFFVSGRTLELSHLWVYKIPGRKKGVAQEQCQLFVLLCTNWLRRRRSCSSHDPVPSHIPSQQSFWQPGRVLGTLTSTKESFMSHVFLL